MITLTLKITANPDRTVQIDKPLVTIGRSSKCDIVIPADNISSQHGQIELVGGGYVYRDLKSTNGSLIIRREEHYMLDSGPREMLLNPGDRICLASSDNVLIVDRLTMPPVFSDDLFDRTILAEQNTQHPDALQTSLGEDFVALRALVDLARELSTLDNVRTIADHTCHVALDGFPRARRAMFLSPREHHFGLDACACRTDSGEETPSTLMNMRPLIDRCLRERKGYLFLFEQDRMQAIATRIFQSEAVEPTVPLEDRVILCCPLLYNEQCYGFLEIEGQIEGPKRTSLNRRDLALATLMAHLIASRLHDLEQQTIRLKLARKATAGYLAATVGHCFKNLLFVPMSLGKMLPVCLRDGRMDEVQWMLARNTVSIRYLDILSNEFAAASKDPTEGFERCDLAEVVREVSQLIEGTAPDKVETGLTLPSGGMFAVCHGAALKRLLMNLTLNAVDAIFSQKRETKGKIELTLETERERGRAVIVVHDDGPGIPAEVLVNLRSIYEKVRASTDALSELQNIAEEVRSTKEKGFKEHYGLGFLFICQTVHQHQGDMTITAEAGVGSTFRITLPFAGPSFLQAAGTRADLDTGEDPSDAIRSIGPS